MLVEEGVAESSGRLGQNFRNLPGKMDLSSAGIPYLHETAFRWE